MSNGTNSGGAPQGASSRATRHEQPATRRGRSARTGRSRWISLGYVMAMGLLFALLQSGLFFQLQLRLTSAYPSFLTVTLAWLVGSVAGLWLGRRSPGTTMLAGWMAASLVSFYLVMVLLRLFPYRIECLPVMGLLICVCGIQAGHFFGANGSLFESSSSLFFWENNGFLLGWIVGYMGYVRFGNPFHWASPALAGLLALVLRLPFAGRGIERTAAGAEGSPA